MTIQEALDRLAESRRTLQLALQGLSEERLTQVRVEGVWTAKDVLGHITAWEEVCLEPLRRFSAGQPFEVEVIRDYQAWNERQAAQKCDLPLPTILDDLAAVRAALVQIAAELSPAQAAWRVQFPWGGQGTIAAMLDGLHWHEMEHLGPISLLSRGPASSD